MLREAVALGCLSVIPHFKQADMFTQNVHSFSAGREAQTGTLCPGGENGLAWLEFVGSS